MQSARIGGVPALDPARDGHLAPAAFAQSSWLPAAWRRNDQPPARRRHFTSASYVAPAGARLPVGGLAAAEEQGSRPIRPGVRLGHARNVGPQSGIRVVRLLHGVIRHFHLPRPGSSACFAKLANPRLWLDVRPLLPADPAVTPTVEAQSFRRVFVDLVDRLQDEPWTRTAAMKVRFGIECETVAGARSRGRSTVDRSSAGRDDDAAAPASLGRRVASRCQSLPQHLGLVFEDASHCAPSTPRNHSTNSSTVAPPARFSYSA